MGKRLYREYDEEGQLIKLECSNCGEIKTVDNFYTDKSRKYGVRLNCKKCISEKQKQYSEEHKDKRFKYNKQYYEEHKDKKLKYSKQYYEEHKDEKLKRYKQYCEGHKDERRERSRKYHSEHKLERREYKRIYYQNKINQEINKIYENVTKQLYPHEGIQYGVIYGVHCKITDRWYIGQTVKSFKLRYYGDFFNRKFNDLLENNNKCQLLQDDIEKYGQENFEIFEVLDVAFSEKELDEKEAYYIDYYKAYDEGYNSNRGNIFKHNKSKRKEVI